MSFVVLTSSHFLDHLGLYEHNNTLSLGSSICLLSRSLLFHFLFVCSLSLTVSHFSYSIFLSPSHSSLFVPSLCFSFSHFLSPSLHDWRPTYHACLFIPGYGDEHLGERKWGVHSPFCLMRPGCMERVQIAKNAPGRHMERVCQSKLSPKEG